MKISVIIADANGNLLTGEGASTALKILRAVDGYMLDWSDLTFKASGWGSLATPLVEVDTTNLPGAYQKEVAITTWADGFYSFLMHFDDATTVLNFQGEQYIQGGREVEVNLDAAVSTRAPEAAGNVAAIKADVEHVTYGLSALLTAIGTRMATFTYTAPDSAATIAAAVWAMATSALTAVGSIGKKLADWIITAPVQIFEGFAVTVNSDLLTVTLDGVASKLTLKQGEAKTLTFTVKDAAGVVVNLSAATLTLGVKKAKTDTAYALTKVDGVFGKTQAALGIVTVALAETDTDLPEDTYIGELKLSWAAGTVIEKTADFYLQIKGAVIPAA